ncbi:MAG: SDR family NAD(P)-dependent oxidoreductase [Candidatus Diapherotrites archaeon]|uniref:SDR family NAD(P)-dependent oxidoreductase n=1 Tax=Candidatus Iainarchaeum sp. TaxID=3101447 RepID=A0A8T3YI11_9ARCH|nr:SDR family NAD(P)-dependent oxidoreductase [Candidatus Diapherotrites archaeon]
MDFGGKTIVITGASSGIGRETAILFASTGARLALVGRNRKRLSSVALECRNAGAHEAMELVCDVRDYGQVKGACAAIMKRFRELDVLVNNAGFGAYHAFKEQEIGELEDMMRTNFFGTVYFTKELLPALARGSHIVNIGSMAGKLAFPNYSGYCASKFAVSAFTESLYHELLPEGIGVHLICPVGTKTGFFDNPSFEGHPHRIRYDSMMLASAVAEMVADAIRKNRPETVPTIRERAILLLKYNLPWLYRSIMQGNYLKRKTWKTGQQGK